MTVPRQLSLLKGVRQRGERPPSPSEFQIQCAVADRLAWDIRPGWFWSHIGHGERRDRVTAARLKRMGVRPGCPDFILIGPKQCGFFFMEIKCHPNRLTEEQRIFCTIARAAGGTFAVAYGVDEAVGVLKNWGCLRGIVRE